MVWDGKSNVALVDNDKTRLGVRHGGLGDSFDAPFDCSEFPSPTKITLITGGFEVPRYRAPLVEVVKTAPEKASSMPAPEKASSSILKHLPDALVEGALVAGLKVITQAGEDDTEMNQMYVTQAFEDQSHEFDTQMSLEEAVKSSASFEHKLAMAEDALVHACKERDELAEERLAANAALAIETDTNAGLVRRMQSQSKAMAEKISAKGSRLELSNKELAETKKELARVMANNQQLRNLLQDARASLRVAELWVAPTTPPRPPRMVPPPPYATPSKEKGGPWTLT